MPSFALKVTRLALSGLSGISPRLAGKAAFALFCRTPSRRPAGQKARATHAMGRERLAAAERIRLTFAGGGAMAYRLNGGARGDRKRYLVLHGWGSSSEYISELVASLARDGAEVIALDLPGHGRSPGRSLTIRMAVLAVAAAGDRFGRFDAIVGHSFGGASAAVAAVGLLPGIRPVLPGRLVLIGAPSSMSWLFADFGKLVRLSSPAQQSLEAEVRRVTGRGLLDYDVRTRIGALELPVLVIHAEDDKEVDAHHARAYATAGAHVRMLWANGFGHRRIVSAPPVLAAIGDFLAEPPIGSDVPRRAGLTEGAETVIPFSRAAGLRPCR